MTKAELISSLVEKKIRENNSIDVFAYTTGLNDMYDMIDTNYILSNKEHEFNELQAGDWFEGTKEQYCQVLKLENPETDSEQIEKWADNMVSENRCCFTGSKDLFWFFRNVSDAETTKLTFLEFYRRAKNINFKELQNTR